MRSLREYLDNIEPLFTKGGRLEKLSALYEIIDTVLYTPGNVTRGAPHVRDGIDLKRLMIMVVFAATPVALFGMWNTGFQANAAMAEMGIEAAAGWRGAVLDLLAIGYDPGSIWACFWHGLL
ncbi:MAG: RnfABCDGE type electron transport complex subunit D, partial [Gammaproteobacteria bacterium]